MNIIIMAMIKCEGYYNNVCAGLEILLVTRVLDILMFVVVLNVVGEV